MAERSQQSNITNPETLSEKLDSYINFLYLITTLSLLGKQEEKTNQTAPLVRRTGQMFTETML